MGRDNAVRVSPILLVGFLVLLVSTAIGWVLLDELGALVGFAAGLVLLSLVSAPLLRRVSSVRASGYAAAEEAKQKEVERQIAAARSSGKFARFDKS